MPRDVKLARVDRRQAIPNEFPAPRARMWITTFEDPFDHGRSNEAAQPGDPDEDDDLRAARGILTAGLLSIGLWAVIGLVVWLIAR
jgi:hypothetical protein